MTPFASVLRRTIEFETATTGSWGNWGSLGVNPSEGERVLGKLGAERGGRGPRSEWYGAKVCSEPHPQPQLALTPSAPPNPLRPEAHPMFSLPPHFPLFFLYHFFRSFSVCRWRLAFPKIASCWQCGLVCAFNSPWACFLFCKIEQIISLLQVICED